ncbi:MAG: rRNA pseudouridine synthase [Proteobacteria bacterium]|jgi:23S rRNA pseudouridine2605 synthase|nr:rRNA pseudouridine synthase [Pseudomonadota bacterium]MBK9253148.1 rRNA pseudouridine synthase [Pseudomonadota bacterium]MCC6631955.1 rRNA pseudouridine synthase [Gammaproteobacteria bacterium]
MSGEAERVQKILSRAGLASRRQAEEWIRAGRVTINGEPAELGSRASGHDKVRLDGKLVHQAPSRRSATWLCHRSPGENLLPPREPDGDAAQAQTGRDAVSERLSRRVGRRHISISPMPRIDGGLELLTSDGELAAKLQRAVRGLPMEFGLRVRGELSAEQIEGILGGELDSGEKMQIESCEPSGGEGSNRWYKVLATGANGRDLRALVERQNALVSRVLRVALGGLKLERTLARGHVRQLTDEEISSLLQSQAGEADTAD